MAIIVLPLLPWVLLRGWTAPLYLVGVSVLVVAGAPGITVCRRWTKSDWDEEAKTWVGDFRPYDLRHTCASLMIRAHVPPAGAAAQLGTSLELLFRTYSQHRGDERQAAHFDRRCDSPRSRIDRRCRSIDPELAQRERAPLNWLRAGTDVRKMFGLRSVGSPNHHA